MPKAPATVPVAGSATGLPAEGAGVVNHDPHPSHNRAPLRSPPHGRLRNLNPSPGRLHNPQPGRLHNPRPGPRPNRSPSPARFRNPPHGRLRSLCRSPNLGPCPSPRLVRWPLPPSLNLNLSPGRFRRTRSIRRLPPGNRGWAGLRAVSLEIAPVPVTSVA